MRTFSYRARTTDGAEVRGHFAAESAPAAVRALAAQGRMVVRLEERREFHLPSFLRMHSNITAEERIAFFHELAALLQAGMPVHEALARLADAAKASSAAYGKLVAELHRLVTRGTALSQAMEMHPQAFAPSVVGMVRAAEESGTLDVILRETAEFLTEGHVMRESLRSALAYPLFLLAAATASLLLMTIFVLPIFAALLRDLRAEVPLPTQLLLTLSDIAAAEPYLIPLSIAVVFAAAAALLRMPKVRFRMDELLLRIPVLGTFICLAEWRMILRTLAILMRSGIRLDRAVSLARSVTQNRALSHRAGTPAGADVCADDGAGSVSADPCARHACGGGCRGRSRTPALADGGLLSAQIGAVRSAYGSACRTRDDRLYRSCDLLCRAFFPAARL